MEYCKFLEAVKASVEKKIQNDKKVFINHVTKNNGSELDGIVIMKEDNNISPNIYLNQFFEQYQNGMSIEAISNRIIQVYNDNTNKINIDSEFFLDFENIKNRIVYKVINYERNKRLLEQIPHKKVLDLAVVYYCLLEQFEEMSATMLIYNEHIKMWNVSAEDIYKAAYENTSKLLKYSIKSMSAIIIDKINSEKIKNNNDLQLNQEELQMLKESDMFILTNSSRLNGSACMIYDDVLSEFADKIKSDLYILPSSIHEVIILPKKKMYKKSDLQNMVKEVNMESLSPDEVLSDKVYIFKRENKILTM